MHLVKTNGILIPLIKKSITIFTLQHVLLLYIYNFDYLHCKVSTVFLKITYLFRCIPKAKNCVLKTHTESYIKPVEFSNETLCNLCDDVMLSRTLSLSWLQPLYS